MRGFARPKEHRGWGYMIDGDKADESSIGELELKLRQGQSSTFSTFPPRFNRGSSY